MISNRVLGLQCSWSELYGTNLFEFSVQLHPSNLSKPKEECCEITLKLLHTDCGSEPLPVSKV